MPSSPSRILCGIFAAFALAGGAEAALPQWERQALLDLYSYAGGPTWVASDGWNGVPGTECTWFGITCDSGQSHVTSVILRNNHLSGTIYSTFSGLSAVEEVDLSGNDLAGSVEWSMYLGSVRRLNISGNRFSGLLFGPRQSTEVFDVSNNQISGPLPTPLNSLGALTTFNVSHNQLSGTIPALTELTALSNFDVSHNQLTGTIPPIAGLNFLRRFDVSDNDLSGPLPAITSGIVSAVLCPNRLQASLTSADNDAWNKASGLTPWYSACSTDTTPVAQPVPDQAAVVGLGFGMLLNVYVTPALDNFIRQYAVISGTLPPGLVLDPVTGWIAGAPTHDGDYLATIVATDQHGGAATMLVRISVRAWRQSVINVVGGAHQAGAIGQTLPQRFAIKVTDGQNNPQHGVRVEFGPNYCVQFSSQSANTCDTYNQTFGHFESGDTGAFAMTDSDGIALAPPYITGLTVGARSLMVWTPDVDSDTLAIDFTQIPATPTEIIQGLWAIGAQTGSPGGGVQLEVHNGLMVMTMYGYDPDGHGDFYLASGPFSDGVFSAELVPYRNGRYFGGPGKSATAIESRGRVTAAFADGKNGLVQFWNQSGVSITKFDWSGSSTNPSAPINGLWAVDNEVDGRPGRGFQIETQGDVLVLLVFAYEKSGRGSFYLTSGTLNDFNDGLPLLRQYINGSYLGGPIQVATDSGTNPGPVSLRFTDPSHGSIQFPNEPVLSISKFSW